ncbi:MAG: competence/damage-inducible protein A [Aristaeellaceae bacterium]
MIAEILCIGTELLMGQVLNTNAQFLSRRLSALGISQYHQTVVGDNAERLEAAYRLALRRADVVITSGGLGPTVDDITKRVAAKVAGQELVLFPEAESMVRERFRQYHRDMTPNNLSQAMFTPDTTLLLNPNGTAPGAIVPMGGGKVVIHLPGPPMELEPMFVDQVEPYLLRRSGRALVSRYIRIFGMGEAEVDSRLRDLMDGSNPTLSPYCSLGEVMLRATASADTAEGAAALLPPLLAQVQERLGDVIYAIEEDDRGSLAKSAVEAMKALGWTCATCESLTGGMIVSAMVGVPGASSVVRGGLVTYQTDTKTLLAGVPAEVIAQYDVVSAEVAREMARGTREKLGVDIAVSATGLAGPDGGTAEKPVGTVFVGVATREKVWALPLSLTGNRERIRTLTMKHALNALLRTALSSYNGMP